MSRLSYLRPVVAVAAAFWLTVSGISLAAEEPQTLARSGSSLMQRPEFERSSIDYKFADRDWKSLVSKLHTARPPSEMQVHAFINAMTSEPSEGDSVCSDGFFILSGSNDESLVASVDVNGRHYCNDLVVIHGGTDGVTMQWIFAWEIDDVKSVIRDVDNSGKNALMIPMPASEYGGANTCMATWTEIFTMHSGVLSNSSTAYRAFYETRHNILLNTGIGEAKLKDVNDGGDRAVCVQMEADRIERFLGISPTAGEERAIEWSTSSNEYLRQKGFAVLADIGDRKSIAILRDYSLDHDSRIAEDAARAMRRVGVQ